MHRFYAGRKIAEQSFVIANPEQLKQILKVLRLSLGDRIALFDNSGSDFEMEIVQIDNNSLSLQVVEKYEGIGFAKNVTLYQALLKKDNLEWVAQKVTELGVTKIVPLITKRVVKDDLSKQGIARLTQIITEATEQSGGSIIPVLGELMTFKEAIKEIDPKHLNLMAYEQEKSRILTTDELSFDNISLFIGPEGGFDPEEYKLAVEHGIISISLGKRILRAETAAIAAAAKILI